MNLTKAIPALLLAPALAGCFTGIESTPRISDSEVRKAGVTLSPEQILMTPVSPEPPSSWRQGKTWLVDDDKIAVIFTAASSPATSLRGRVMSLAGSDTYLGVAADTLVELTFTTDAADTLVYRPGITRTDMLSRRSLEIPFAIELAPVATADSLLRGRTLFVTTPNWRDQAGKPADGLRHVPVTISAVRPGTAQYPLRVIFSDSSATTYSLLLTYGQGPAATRNLDRMFSFTDPRDKYPHITPGTWDKIIHSRVATGMTRDECRLALGAPATISRTGNNAGQYERWNYDQGIYLIFEDGILIRFRQ